MTVPGGDNIPNVIAAQSSLAAHGNFTDGAIFKVDKDVTIDGGTNLVVREILESFFDGSPIRDPYLIVQNGQLAGMGAHSYSKGSSTSGSEEAANYKK
mgnify:CR=1 FL=1